MVPESKLEKTEHGLVPKSEGWFVLDMRDAEWRHVDGRGAACVVADDFEGWRQLDQLGVNPFVLRSGERWPCTTGRPIGRTSSSSRVKRF